MRLLSSKKLLDAVDSPMDSATLFKALGLAGILEKKEYVSSSGSGEIKHFWAFTDNGATYGIDQETMSPTKTEPRFYESEFHKTLMIAAETILQHSRGVTPFGKKN